LISSGLAVFNLIRGNRHDAAAVLYAFDLLELDGEDPRFMPIEERKRIRAKRMKASPSKSTTRATEVIFKHACVLGCEGIVSIRHHSLRFFQHCRPTSKQCGSW
jgi:ATP-dependent DNA ligase